MFLKKDLFWKLGRGIASLILIIIILSLVSSFDLLKNPSAAFITKNMIENSKRLKTMKYTMKKTERIGNSYLIQSSHIKFQKKPFKVYIKQITPRQGLEVVYIENWNGNKAKINPNGFPWFQLSLNPLDSKMRKNQHHTLFDTGFDYFISILEHLDQKYGDKMRTMVSNKGLIKWNEQLCWDIEFNNPFYEIIPLTITSGNETVLTVAKNLKISEYKICELNSELKGYVALKKGQVIQVPNDYSIKMRLLIDKEKMVPCLIETYDRNGLYERYEITNIELNTLFSNEEFMLE